ncbi:flagellar brake protein [Konateibacter massiliensis]|uniref:flagellar brake protein n=1 Tax=Konateibacter massiliensis TaxID=2002841 RepID=UPI000C155F16|nr:flagellar brake domain-containing protein [Konateibacter massiliensis]
MSDIISIGNKVELRIVKNRQITDTTEKEYRTYKSKIIDEIDEKTIKLAMPIEGGNLVLLPTEVSLEIFFYTENGLYQSKGKVVERKKEGNLFTVIFELSQPILKNQRREFYRLNCIIDMKYAKINETECQIEDPQIMEELRGQKLEWQEGFIVDISGGGIRFTGGERFEEGSYAIITFTIIVKHIMKQFSTTVKVISSDKILNRSGQYENRAKYISMRTDEKEEIVRYIFEEERKVRKNRKS